MEELLAQDGTRNGTATEAHPCPGKPSAHLTGPTGYYYRGVSLDRELRPTDRAAMGCSTDTVETPGTCFSRYRIRVEIQDKMSGGKKRSGFQITSVTSDYTQSSGEAPPHVQASSQSNPSLQSSSQSTDSSQPGLSHQQGSFSQPTTPLSLRKSHSQDAVGQGSRFRVVRLGQGHGGPYCRGRWTCTDSMEREEGVGPRWVMDSMRHAHSLESLEGIGLQRAGGGAGGELLGHVRTLRTGHLVHSQGTSHLLAQLVASDGEGFGGLKPLLHSDPPNPTHLERFNLRVVDSMPPLPSPRPRNIPPPLRLDVDATGRSLLRVSHSQPSSPGPPLQGRDGTFLPSLIPIQTTSAWSMFGSGEAVHLPGDDREGENPVPDHDGPSTSKSIPLQSTGLGVTLIPSTINVNPTITPVGRAAA
ncbi:TSC22 domain family protein 2-like isoform X2 [Oncorhynchus clarkii lewisi]|uniref:TSC22 domain family protein 2-like isoform X2 n=1 Tax=Oncorhynchus clarkii lewisi TaxID=490388 RepID=UPI0039B969F9